LRNFARTLSTLLAGGTPLVAGLQTAGDAIESRLLRGTVASATQKVREGDSPALILSSMGIMPELALDMIEVGESSGALAPMLTSVRGILRGRINLRLGAMVSLIEPAILIFHGIVRRFYFDLALFAYFLDFSYRYDRRRLERNPWERHTKTSRSTLAGSQR